VSLRDFVYIARRDTDGLIKIGSSWNPAARVMSLSHSATGKVRLLKSFRGGPADERALHERFAASCAFGEWFYPAPSLLSFIESLP